jgi:glycosyltransferase involved in cell wall biosynthesis
MLLRALAHVKKTVPLLYLHVGKEETNRPELELSYQLRVENEVRFMGSQSDPRLFFWAADVFVMPSLYEGLGNSSLEAIACGCPTILTEVSGLMDIVTETKWAISVGLDEEAIAAGLLRVASIPADTRRSRALEDSSRIRARFSMQRGVRVMVESLYAVPSRAAVPSIHAANQERT